MSASACSIRFVCQGGGLDLRSAFLAASLKRHLRCEHQLVACVPEGAFAPPAAGVVDFLRHLGARVEAIRNPISDGYPIANKMAAFALEDDAERRVFLDSDVLCIRDFAGFPIGKAGGLQAKLEDWNHHAHEEWRTLYDYLELGPPEAAFRSTVLDEPMPLYFNAGVLVLDAPSDLPSRWIALAQAMEAHLSLPRQRPNLDQLSLAGLVVRDAVPYALLDEDHNFPGELRSLDHARLPYLCHYHNPIMVTADAYLSGVVGRLCRTFPALRELAAARGAWPWTAAADRPIAPLPVLRR